MPLAPDCARFDDLWTASLDRALDGAEHAAHDAHLAACPACVRRVQEYVLTTRILQEVKAFEEAEAAPPLAESLVTRILAARRSAQRVDRDQAQRTG
jgi:hypothetical protein